MEAEWKIFTDAKNEEKASKTVNNLLKQLDIKYKHLEIEPYHKGGFTASFIMRVTADTWPEAVIEVFAKAQLIGRSWIISGDIETELDAWSNNSSVSGVTNLHVILGG